MLNSIEDILEKEDAEYSEIYIEEWGDNVRLRAFNAKQLMEFGLSQGNDPLGYAKAAAMSIVDENGKRIIPDSKIAEFAEKSGKALKKIVKEVLKLNKLDSQEDEELKKSLEETDT